MRIAIASLLALLVLTGTAQGHATVVATTPAADAVLARAPAAVRIRFSEAIRGGADPLVVVAADGAFQSGPPRLSGTLLTAALGAMTAGRYACAYDVVSADGHEVAAAFAFAIRRRTPRAVAVDVPLGAHAVRLSGARVGVRTLRLWGRLREGTVRWTHPGVPAPFVWTFADGRAQGMLPFAGTYTVEVRARTGVFGEIVASGAVEIAP